MPMPLSQSTNPNSAASMRMSAIQPIATRPEFVLGTDWTRTTNRAAPTVIINITDISSSSAAL